MLSHPALRAAIAGGDVGWTGPVRGDALLVELGDALLPFATGPGALDPLDPASVAAAYGPELAGWDVYDLGPGELVLCRSRLPLRLGPAVVGVLGTLSHVARLGLMTHLDSPIIDAGTDGHLALELLNVGTRPVRLRPGLPVAKLTVWARTGGGPEPCRPSPYGEGLDLRSRYAAEFGAAAGRPRTAEPVGDA